MLGTRKAKYIHERFWTDLSYQLKGGLAKERYLQAQSRLWAGDMTPILRAGTNPAEDLSSSPRTCVKWLPTSCNSSSTGSNILFCLCWVLNACLETHKNTHVQAITNKSLKTEQTKMCKESDNWNWGLLNWDLATKKCFIEENCCILLSHGIVCHSALLSIMDCISLDYEPNKLSSSFKLLLCEILGYYNEKDNSYTCQSEKWYLEVCSKLKTCAGCSSSLASSLQGRCLS